MRRSVCLICLLSLTPAEIGNSHSSVPLNLLGKASLDLLFFMFLIGNHFQL